MRWSVRLFCGHTVERTAHRSYTVASRAFSASPTKCPECGLAPTTIVDARASGLVEGPTTPYWTSARPAPRLTRAKLEQRVGELKAELAALKNADE